MALINNPGSGGNTNFTDGSIPYSSGGILTENNTNFKWDNATTTLYVNGVAFTPGKYSASTGASFVGFTQSGTGTVSSDLQTDARTSKKLTHWMTAAQIADAAAGTRSIDCSAAVQAAITSCIANNFDLEVPYQVLMSSAVNIDRQVDGLAYDKYFRIFTKSGGGFYTTSLANLFTSSIAFTTAPVSQLVYFDGLNFESDIAATRYVLNGGRFLRTRFHGCTFDKILCVNSSIYTQSNQITNCNMRRGSGVFWTSTTTTLDFKFMGNIVEAWTGNFMSLAAAQGCAIIGNLLEGISGTAIVYNGAKGFAVHGNYFESNGLDIDGTGATQALGVAILGNFFAHSPAGQYSVIWGNGAPLACVSMGNYHNGSMHSVPSGADIFIKDVAATNTQNNPTTPLFPSMSAALGTVGSTLSVGVSPIVVGTEQIHATANATLALTDAVLGTNYGGAVRGYGVGGQGGYVELGSFDAGVYTAHIRSTQTGAVTVLGSSPSIAVNGGVTAVSGGAIPAGGTAGAGFMVSSTANFGVFFGSGVPTLTAAKGSLYLRSDGSSTTTRMYVNTDGGTTWTAVTTVA